jgi:class 3 adenylate cyclase
MRDLPRGDRLRLARTFILMGALTALAITVFFFSTPRWTTEHYVNSFAPQSKAFARLDLAVDFRTLQMWATDYDEHQKNVTVEATVVGGDGLPHTMRVDLPGLKMAYEVTRGSSWTWTTVFDEAELLKWMKEEARLDTANPAVRKEAGELVTLLKEFRGIPPASWREFVAIAKADLGSYQFRGFSSSMLFNGRSVVLITLAGLGCYILAIVRVRRRVLSRHKAAMIAAGEWEEDPPTEMTPPSRTLSVLFADLKDFTGQAATLSRARLLALLRRQRTVVERAIAPHDGRIVKTMGDGLIVTFDSATNAVLAALAIQSDARRAGIELRIGITTGEVTLEADDVYGPAVNVAARLQAIADAGEVLFSDATRHAIHSAEVTSEDLGPRELKGVPGTVRVHRARP